MPSLNEDAKPLIIDASDEDVFDHPENSRKRRPRRSCFLSYMGIIVPWTALILLCTWVLVQYRRRGPSNPLFPQLTYSPVQDLLEYEARKFRLGFHDDITEYQGQPSPELDARWSALYDMGITNIPLKQAEKLVNKTIIYPHDPERRYIIELDVFHQLHCLNMIRKALHPDYYPPHKPGPDQEDELLGPHHIDHCIDNIRQSLMCSVDVSVLTWEWDEERQMHFEKGTILHTCRNFEKIQDWARQNSIKPPFDNRYREMNDPLDPSTWLNDYSP